jgi:ribosome assembly protein 4
VSFQRFAKNDVYRNLKCSRFATGSKDCTIKIWDVSSRTVLLSLTSHTAPVTCLVWGGEGLLYSSSRDKSVRVWDASKGILVRVLEGHGHWVNSLAVSSGGILKSFWFDEKGKKYKSMDEGNCCFFWFLNVVVIESLFHSARSCCGTI